MSENYQYRVKADDSITSALDDSKHAGELFRTVKKNASPGTIVSLEKRKVGPWVTEESIMKE